MKIYEELQKDAQNAIKWQPVLHAIEIGVTVMDGVLTLSGEVDKHIKKVEIETAAKDVGEAKVVVKKNEIKYHSPLAKPDDNDIADEITNFFNWNWTIPSGKIKVKVEKGWVFIERAVSWSYQKEAAKNAVKSLLGVKGLSNSVMIESETQNVIE